MTSLFKKLLSGTALVAFVCSGAVTPAEASRYDKKSEKEIERQKEKERKELKSQKNDKKANQTSTVKSESSEPMEGTSSSTSSKTLSSNKTVQHDTQGKARSIGSGSSQEMNRHKD